MNFLKDIHVYCKFVLATHEMTVQMIASNIVDLGEDSCYHLRGYKYPSNFISPFHSPLGPSPLHPSTHFSVSLRQIPPPKVFSEFCYTTVHMHTLNLGSK